MTLLNRGNVDDQLGTSVKRIRVDRQNSTALRDSLINLKWDFVFDQICFDAHEARVLCETLEGKTERLVFTSTQSIYGMGFGLREEMFDPFSYKPEKYVSRADEYGEAKRQAEAVFASYTHLNPVMIRMPIVLGNDDHTGRLRWHVEHVANEEPVFFPNRQARLKFVRSNIAGRAIAEIARTKFTGPINCACPGEIRLDELMNVIEEIVGRRAVYSKTETDLASSPFGAEEDWTMDTTKMESLGIDLPKLETWLPTLIREFATQLAANKDKKSSGS